MTDKPKQELEIGVIAWLDLYKKLQAEIKQLEERAADARTHIEHALGDAEIGTFNGKAVVRWSKVVTNRFDTSEAKKILAPAIYAYLSKESTSRRFTVVVED